MTRSTRMDGSREGDRARGEGSLGREIVQSLSLIALMGAVLTLYVGLGLLAAWVLA